MHTPDTDSPEAMAGVLALVLVADTTSSAEEREALDKLGVCDRIGLPHPAFMAITRGFEALLAHRVGSPDALRLPDPVLVDRVLDRVHNPGLRLLVARLAAGLIVADGRVRGVERRLYLHLLSRGGLSEWLVAEAIRAERRPFADALAEP
jgi:hypothetical protein